MSGGEVNNCGFAGIICAYQLWGVKARTSCALGLAVRSADSQITFLKPSLPDSLSIFTFGFIPSIFGSQLYKQQSCRFTMDNGSIRTVPSSLPTPPSLIYDDVCLCVGAPRKLRSSVLHSRSDNPQNRLFQMERVCLTVVPLIEAQLLTMKRTSLTFDGIHHHWGKRELLAFVQLTSASE